MKYKVIALCVALTAGIATLIGASQAGQKLKEQQIAELEARDKKYRLTLRDRVKLAKLRGEQAITIQTGYSTILYPSVTDMDTAVAVYTIIIAKPVTMVGRLGEGDRIVSSYRFQTVELLSEPPREKDPFTFNGQFPAELGTFESGDFMVTTLGGTVSIDGVEVTTKYDDFELFTLGKEYLLFLNFDTNKTLGGLAMGPHSALEINADGTLETLDRQQTHDIKRIINSRFSNSVEVLKFHLKNHPGRKGRGAAHPAP